MSISSLFSWPVWSAAQPLAAETSVTLHEGSYVNAVIPTKPLAKESIAIVGKTGQRFADWTGDEDAECYDLLQKIAKKWSEKGIQDYLVIEREVDGEGFGWEIVPFSAQNEWCYVKQIQVAWRLFFGGINLSDEDKKQMVLSSEYLAAPAETSSLYQAIPDPKCAFCRESVIESQRVFEGINVRILYDYRPLVRNHFLVTTVEHDQKFSNVSKEAYLEAAELARKLIHDIGTNHSLYLFHKTGKAAGQTVPHWHMHVVLPDSKTEESWGKLNEFVRMIFGASALKSNELQSRVASFKEQLGS